MNTETHKTNNLPAIIFVVVLLLSTSIAVYSINHSHQHTSPETWTAFIYKNGYQSAKYEMEDGFEDYPSCKSFATRLSDKFAQAPWQCGLRCRFDSMRQGYQCESMENH